jgi:2-polyprenyl-3-methyl-5-hydroxy-6-metoxy-1,4-benzoquinol methylase
MTDHENRRIIEEEFHDRKYSKKNCEPAHYDCNPTYVICQEMINSLGDISGKVILECGCGDGWMTVELASRGAKVYAFDISGESVKETQNFLIRKNLAENCIVEKKAAENLDYENETFDIVIGFAVLHHVDMDKVIPLLYRMLKKNGILVFAEPLRGNPLLDLYRKFTPEFRTPDERPFKISELKKYLNSFYTIFHKEYYFMALFPLFMTNISLLRFMKRFVTPFCKFDNLLFSILPFVRNYAWYTLFRCTK